MVDVSALNRGTQILQTARTSDIKPITTEQTAGGNRLDRAQESRPATDRAAAINIDLSDASDADAVQEKLREGLTGLFKVFYKSGGLEEAVDRALDGLSSVVDKAAENGGDALQIGLASVERFFGGGSGIRQFAVEVGIVQDGEVKAADLGIVDLSGEKIDLSTDQRQRGIANSVFQLGEQPQDDTASAASKARQEALTGALDRLNQVQDALAAYRAGDSSGIQRLEQLLRGDSNNQQTASALGRLSNSGQADSGQAENDRFFPGTGIIRS